MNKEELIEKGHIFKTDADTEVLVHGYEEYGRDLLKRLRGMYAFALWDRQKKQLLMARDIFGIKPLFYTTTKTGDFVFGSEIKSIVKFPTFEKEFNERYEKLGLTPHKTNFIGEGLDGSYIEDAGVIDSNVIFPLKTTKFEGYDLKIQSQKMKDEIFG